jgi:hypothetical protein
MKLAAASNAFCPMLHRKQTSPADAQIGQYALLI